MKKIIKQFSCCLLCILLMVASTGVMAEDVAITMNTSWKGNYSSADTELVITFKSPAEYPQQVTAILYDKSVDNPTFLDYRRVAEVMSVNGTETTFAIKLGNDLSATDGKYKLTLRGNGNLSARSTETVTVTILTPAAKATALSSINGAITGDALATELTKVKEALQLNLPADTNALNRLMSEVVKVRNSSDYNGNFAMLNEVSDAYTKAEIIVYLESAIADVAGLCDRIEKNSVLFGFDKTDEDYITNKEDIYKTVINLKNSYKGTGIRTWQQLISAINETIGVEYINHTDILDIHDAVVKYKSVVGISDTSYNSYLTLIDSSKEKVQRQLYASGFETAEQVKKAFEDAVNAELNPSQDLGGITPGTQQGGNITIGGGTGGGGGGGGGAVIAPPQPKDKFSDVSSSHWAYTYVENLSELGIISGYPDGTYKGEKTVSREEFVKMIISAAGLYDETAECEFSDVNVNDWFYKYIASARKAGVVSGVSQEYFGVGTPITREDVALIGARIFDKLKDTKRAESKSATTSFTDNDAISEYAIGGVAALVNIGVINGFEDGTFRPGELLTRAQAAKIIYMVRAKI